MDTPHRYQRMLAQVSWCQHTEIIPAGLESVNGSDPTMGCTEPITSNGMVSCMSNDTGFLTEENVPTIQMNTSNWASELVTIRRVGYNQQLIMHL